MSPRRAGNISVEHALLGFLLEQPLHGYEIHQRLQEARALGLIWHVKQAHMYALLAKLEADGLIVAELIAQESRPPRRLLHLTPEGRHAFETWLATPVVHGRDVRIEFLAKLFWAQHVGPEIIQQLLDTQRTATQALLSELPAGVSAGADEQPYAFLVYQFRRGQLLALLEWLDTCEATLLPVPR